MLRAILVKEARTAEHRLRLVRLGAANARFASTEPAARVGGDSSDRLLLRRRHVPWRCGRGSSRRANGERVEHVAELVDLGGAQQGARGWRCWRRMMMAMVMVDAGAGEDGSRNEHGFVEDGASLIVVVVVARRLVDAVRGDEGVGVDKGRRRVVVHGSGSLGVELHGWYVGKKELER